MMFIDLRLLDVPYRHLIGWPLPSWRLLYAIKARFMLLHILSHKITVMGLYFIPNNHRSDFIAVRLNSFKYWFADRGGKPDVTGRSRFRKVSTVPHTIEIQQPVCVAL